MRGVSSFNGSFPTTEADVRRRIIYTLDHLRSRYACLVKFAVSRQWALTRALPDEYDPGVFAEGLTGSWDPVIAPFHREHFLTWISLPLSDMLADWERFFFLISHTDLDQPLAVIRAWRQGNLEDLILPTETSFLERRFYWTRSEALYRLLEAQYSNFC